MTKIVDTHQHLWDLDVVRLPWLPADGPLAGSHTPEHYAVETEGLGVAATVYMEVDVHPDDFEKEAEYVLALVADPGNPMRGAVLGGRPGQASFAAYASKYAERPGVKGFRQVLHGDTPKKTWLEDQFVASIRLLGELGLRFDLCVRSEDLADAAKLAEMCPDTRFVLDHCGNANVQAHDLSDWKRGMEVVAAQRNVVGKISGIVASAKPGEWTSEDLAPIVHFTAECFGRDRVMFASDWPVCTQTATYRQWVEALRQITAAWSDEDQNKLFHDNAMRFYDL